MMRRELLQLAARKDLERLAKWLKLTITSDCSDADLVEKIHLETLYS